jgi:hypothetical protein
VLNGHYAHDPEVKHLGHNHMAVLDHPWRLPPVEPDRRTQDGNSGRRRSLSAGYARRGQGSNSPGGKRKCLLSKAFLIHPIQAARSPDRHLTVGLDVAGRH